MKECVVFSQCLLGVQCRYDGRCAAKQEVCDAARERGWIPVCPEILGGLCTPRPAAERVGDRVMNRDGIDVTQQFCHGAEQALEIAKLYGARYALLKERSPSCGCGEIYDGTFTGKRIAGDGLTAALFKEHGIQVFGESRLDELIEILDKDDEQ